MHHYTGRFSGGFKLIEFIIVVAFFTVLVNVGWPHFSHFAVRSKITEALVAAESAKRSLVLACEDALPSRRVDREHIAFDLEIALYVHAIELQGTCAAPVIRIHTSRTGAAGDGILNLAGTPIGNRVAWIWTCTSDAEPAQLPEKCRS